MSVDTYTAQKPSMTSSRMFRFFTQAHVFWYRLTNGVIGGRMGKNTVLLLTTKGRKSGKLFVKPLFYLADNGQFAIVASNGGSATAPSWWQNIQANGFAHIQVRSRKLDVTARQASPEEQQRLWPLLTARYPEYADYQHNTTRPIPIVILSTL